MARSNIDIRQLRGLYNTHKPQREECHSDSMQIACGHDPIWIVVGATQHGWSRFTGLAWQPSAIHWKRISSLEDLQAAPPPLKIGRKKKERNESDKQCKKGGIAFWGSLYSASFKKQMQKQARLALLTDAETVIYLGHRQRRHRTLRPRWVTRKMFTLVKFLGKRHTSPPWALPSHS